jgi:hypothetical protein
MDLAFDDLIFLIALLCWYVVIEAKLGPWPRSWVVISDVHQHFLTHTQTPEETQRWVLGETLEDKES